MQQCVVLFGDSIGTSQGVAVNRSFAALLKAILEDHDIRVENWSQGGRLAAGAVQQLATLKRKLRACADKFQGLTVILELGGNDRMFGQPAASIEESLRQLVLAVQSIPAHALLMEVVPDGIEKSVAARCGARLIPSPACLVDTMRQPIQKGRIPRFRSLEYIQDDGLHPNTKAQVPILLELLAGLSAELQLPLELSESDTEELYARNNSWECTIM